MDTPSQRRQLPIGAEALAGAGVHFRVWAPRRRTVAVVLESGPGAPGALVLQPEAQGYFSGWARSAGPGTRYRFRLDDDRTLYPDPAARFQPEGPHGPSEVIDPHPFPWTDRAWGGIRPQDAILYEMHLGTFTPEGTWAAAAERLPHLAALGVNLLEVMPIADFPGQFGWGYDGVCLFAPSRLYGTPDDCRRFIDRAHALGLGVILDVVYNHLGPDGNYLKQFSETVFSKDYHTEWGEALNFDGEGSGPVREFFVANAGYWIDEFHFDGLRFDATQQIFDASDDHILAAVARRVRQAAGKRVTFLVAENELQHARLVRAPDKGGCGLDALWNDDFHHSAMVALTGRNEAYYMDFLGTPQEFVSTAKYGYLYQGQQCKWQKACRGTPALDLPLSVFVTFTQNHDQVANSARGWRSHRLSSPGCERAMTALLLLGPGSPMLFQGQEFNASAPFYYFADHHPDLARLVRAGRGEFLEQFVSLCAPGMRSLVPDPAARATFEACKLDWSEAERHTEVLALYRDLLALRRGDPVFRSPRRGTVDGAVLGAEAFVLRYFGGEHGDRLLLVNFGRDLHLHPAPEPLLAPPEGCGWQGLWSSEDARYGGSGAPHPDSEANWHVPGHAAVVLTPGPLPDEPTERKDRRGTT